MAEQQQPSSASQAALSSARLQHFNYLAPAIQVSQPPLPSRQQPTATERRHYSFDTDTDSRRFSMSTAAALDYDQTEGLGGLSVSSYDSVEDDRSPIEPALHGYPYHGDKSVHYTLPDQFPYTGPSIYPSVPYQIDELGHAPGNYTPSDVSSSISPPNGQIGNNKYSTVPPGERIARALSLEEQSRLSVEEDKRRRNTAASARFRVKKKQREQTLERTVRDANELNASLEARVAQLEMENRWLKNLLTEKNEHGGSSSSSSRMAPPPPPPPENSSALTTQNGGSQSSSTSTRSSGSRKPIQPKHDVGVGTDI